MRVEQGTPGRYSLPVECRQVGTKPMRIKTGEAVLVRVVSHFLRVNYHWDGKQSSRCDCSDLCEVHKPPRWRAYVAVRKPFTVSCPSCKDSGTVPEYAFGLEIGCKACGHRFEAKGKVLDWVELTASAAEELEAFGDYVGEVFRLFREGKGQRAPLRAKFVGEQPNRESPAFEVDPFPLEPLILNLWGCWRGELRIRKVGS